MSAASSSLCEDQFLCSICLDVFTDPVSTPCGHNFCKNCITEHWDVHVPYECPNCKKLFHTRPELQVNTFISEMVAHFRRSAQRRTSSSSSEQQAAKPGEVPCDICSGTKLKALKSCLMCLVSYCETHLEPHLTAPGLKRHQLIHPVENLEGRMCTEHEKLLELFCKDDQTCVCMFCTVLDHKAHDVVPLKEECEGKKAELEKTEAELQQMIIERQLKIQEIKHSVKVSRENVDKMIADAVHYFTKMKDAFERAQTLTLKMFEEKCTGIQEKAEGFIKELEQELSELKKKHDEVEQLSHSEDHLNLLQNFKSLKAVPPTKDWTEVKICPPAYDENECVEEMETMNKFFTEVEIGLIQQLAVDVTLDPDTAHPELILSADRKQVHHGLKQNLPDNPERFSTTPCVLGTQVDSSRLFYFEVQVKEKTDWVLGVAQESVNRKEPIAMIPENGYWTVSLKNENKYYAAADPPVRLSLKSKPEKVGVFVDYKDGLVSFYDVDVANLIYSFTGCSFTEKPIPFFSPGLNHGGKNSASMITCPDDPSTESSSDSLSSHCEIELEFIQDFAVDVTLDPDTAHPELILSADGKQVHHGLKQNLPDNPERFSTTPCVLGTQIDPSGIFYFKVQVKEKTDWVLGVAQESVNRKEPIAMIPENGYWTVSLRNENEYYAAADPPVHLSLKSKPEKVGVFVDCRDGLVSFYDVDAETFIHTFSGCSFTEKLLPFFCPGLNQGGKNSAPMIICTDDPSTE